MEVKKFSMKSIAVITIFAVMLSCLFVLMATDDSYAASEELYALYRSIIKIFIENGYEAGKKEIIEYLQGNCSLDKAIEDIKLNTRHYAKRQITYFKKFDLTRLKPDAPQKLAQIIYKDFYNDRQ